MVPEYEEDFWFEEFDIDFEFDAPRFYDFSIPELDSDTQDIEIWFESAGNYPPSPFSPKFNWKFDPVEISNPESLDTGLNCKDKYNGFIHYNQTVKDVSKKTCKPKSKAIRNGSTLTRPTASLLARQNKEPLDVYSVQLLTRCQRSLGDNLSPLLVSKMQNQDIKRPKLVAKVAHVSRRSKLTVPKEPNLRTAERSQRHRSKVNLETERNAKSTSNSSKRQPTNKNIKLKLSSASLPKSNTPTSQDLQAFRLKSSLRTKERSSNPKSLAIHEKDATRSRRIKPTDSPKNRIVKENQSRQINCQLYDSKIYPLDSKRSSKKLGETTKIEYGLPQSSCRLDMKQFLDANRKFDSQCIAGSLIIA